jgi:GNAT superfamily N-acetyltransferase
MAKHIFERLIKPTSSEIQQIRKIYESNFPIFERKPFDFIVERLEQTHYLCMVMKHPKEFNIILAFSLSISLDDCIDMVFLEYMAVCNTMHGQGIGGELIDSMLIYLRKFKIANGLILEVEPPDLFGQDTNKNKRVRFYQRHGGEIVNFSIPYRMPDYTLREINGIPLLLMQVPMREQPLKEEVVKIVKCIYKVAYPDFLPLRDNIIEIITTL